MSRVLGWAEQGETVEIRRHGKAVVTIQRIVPVGAVRATPDFVARLQRIYGDQVFATPATELIGEGRGER